MQTARTLALATFSTLLTTPALAQQGYGGWGGHGWGDHPMGGFMGPFAGILWLVAVVAIFVGAILLVRYLWNAGHGAGSPARRSDALELLDKRYAAGEIDREEYLKRKEDLQR